MSPFKGKLCFIGAGFHATTNIYPSVIEAGGEIVAVATRDLERSKAALVRFGSHGTPYNGYKEMFEKESFDGVVVIAQPRDQAGIVLDCLRAGKNVYVDKPLGWNATEAEQISAEAKENNSILMVGFMKRYAPVYEQLKEIISSQEFGKVFSFEAKFACDSTPFCKTEEEFVKFASIHFLDLVRFLFGEVENISGYHNMTNEHITQSISVRMANGVVGSLSFIGMTAYSRESENVSITFEHGFATAKDLTTLTTHKSLPPNTDTTGLKNQSWKYLGETDVTYTPGASTMSGCFRDLYLRGFIGEMSHFIDCCVNHQEPTSSGEDNVKTMELVDRVLFQLNFTSV